MKWHRRESEMGGFDYVSDAGYGYTIEAGYTTTKITHQQTSEPRALRLFTERDA